MGLPVNKFICASNRNNVLTDFFRRAASTTQPRFLHHHVAVDGHPDFVNLERLLFFASDFNDKLVAELMGKLNTEGAATR